MRDPLRVSIVMEWANVRLNGEPRARLVLDELARQWREVCTGRLPADVPEEVRAFLATLHPRAELVVMSGDPIDPEQEKEIRERPLQDFDVEIQVEPGADYYPLKNLGAARAGGDLLLFVDSDVLPDPGWLAYLVGAFADPDVSVVGGQTYVAPVGVLGKAFALGWNYPLRKPAGRFVEQKFEGNNVVFRADAFRRAGGFPALGGATRGACRRLRATLASQGIVSWQNRSAAVEHPPPSGFRHLAVRALAHGRDVYMLVSWRRDLRALASGVGTAFRRLLRGVRRAVSQGHRVGVRWYEMPLILAAIGVYHLLFALGALLTWLSPAQMARRFRV